MVSLVPHPLYCGRKNLQYSLKRGQVETHSRSGYAGEEINLFSSRNSNPRLSSLYMLAELCACAPGEETSNWWVS